MAKAKKPPIRSKKKPIEHYAHKNKQVAPDHFMFQLTSDEMAALNANSGGAKRWQWNTGFVYNWEGICKNAKS
jgi:hypothetical protein